MLLDVITGGGENNDSEISGLGYERMEAQALILVKGYRTACVLEGIDELGECV